MKLHWQILVALALAVVAGIFSHGADVSSLAYQFYDFVGTLFLNALKMLIVPLIVSSIICGIANIGSHGSLGRIGSKTVAYYLATSLLSILIGLFFVNMVSPGIINGQSVKDIVGFTADSQVLSQRLENHDSGNFAGLFLRMVPPNIVAAAASGQMLGLIFFGLLFGFFMTKIDSEQRVLLTRFWNALFEVMMRMTEWVMKFAPIGVFGLVAKVLSSTGLAAFIPLAYFFITVLTALAAHFLIVLPLLLIIFAKVRPSRLYKAMLPAIITAFSTSSSSATLPVTLDCIENKVGVSNRTSSFVVPLGATINMDGTALYECVAALFIAPGPME